MTQICNLSKPANIAKSFFSIWICPRLAIHCLIKNENNLTRLKITLSLAFIYLIQYISYLWISNLLPILIKVFSKMRFFEPIALLIGFIFAISVILNLSSIIFFYLTKLIGGKGTFLNTKSVIYWSSLSTIPVGLSFLLFIWSGEANMNAVENGLDRPITTAFLQCFAVLGFIIFIIYGIAILTKMLSEIHNIPSERALASVIAGIISTLVLGPLIFRAAIFVGSI